MIYDINKVSSEIVILNEQLLSLSHLEPELILKNNHLIKD